MQMPTDPQNLLTLGLAALVNILITIMFCRSLIKALSYVSPENKALQSSSIWLLLIPVINCIINFIVVFGMSRSIANELRSRDFEEEERPAFASGITFAILSLVALVSMLVPVPSSFAAVVGVIGFSQIFFFVQYWMKINWYKRVLQNDEEGIDQSNE